MSKLKILKHIQTLVIHHCHCVSWISAGLLIWIFKNSPWPNCSLQMLSRPFDFDSEKSHQLLLEFQPAASDWNFAQTEAMWAWSVAQASRASHTMHLSPNFPYSFCQDNETCYRILTCIDNCWFGASLFHGYLKSYLAYCLTSRTNNS